MYWWVVRLIERLGSLIVDRQVGRWPAWLIEWLGIVIVDYQVMMVSDMIDREIVQCDCKGADKILSSMIDWEIKQFVRSKDTEQGGREGA